MEICLGIAAIITALAGAIVSIFLARLRWKEFKSRDPEWDMTLHFMKVWSNNLTDIEQFAQVYVALKDLKASKEFKHYAMILDKALQADKAKQSEAQMP